MELADLERLRFQYKPGTVSVLFVGESPPKGGTFFYRCDSNLFVETASVFRHFFRRRVHGTQFLAFFRDLGCFLVDLSAAPVDHLPWGSPQRRDLVARGEPLLSERLSEYRPGLIIVTPRGIEKNVVKAAALADCPAPIRSLPFPSRSKKNVESYRRELREALAVGVDLGLLPTAAA